MSKDVWTQKIFEPGDRVRYSNCDATVVEIYPDGIHMIRVDASNQVIATLSTHLTPLVSKSLPQVQPGSALRQIA